MKSSVNTKPRSTNATSPKVKKNAGKDKTEKRKSENSIASGSGKMEPSELIEFLMGESPTTKQYARLSRESVINYAEQSIFEQTPHEVSYNLAEDLSYKLRQITHNAQIKANLSGRTSLLATDIEASFEDSNIDKVYGASNNYNFIPLTDKYLYLDDTIVNLMDLAEETGTVIQPGDVFMQKLTYPQASANSTQNYVRYFDTMCRAIICNTPKLQQEALLDIKRNARIGPIVNWFYHFGYFLLSKDITYVSITLSALNLIEALETNIIARQLVSKKVLKLLLRLILQRLLRSRTDFEVIKPMCNVLAILCKRRPLYDLVVAKVSQRWYEFNTEHALPLACIIKALGLDALRLFINYLFTLFTIAQSEQAPNVDLLVSVLQASYHILCVNNVQDADVNLLFYNEFDYKLVPFWRREVCACRDENREPLNWRNVRAQILKSQRFRKVQQTTQILPLKQVFDVPDKQSYIKFTSASLQQIPQLRSISIIKDLSKMEFIIIGKHFCGTQTKAKTKCMDYAYMVL